MKNKTELMKILERGHINTNKELNLLAENAEKCTHISDNGIDLVAFELEIPEGFCRVYALEKQAKGYPNYCFDIVYSRYYNKIDFFIGDKTFNSLKEMKEEK